jgi:opacity protein-like surface antigen
MKKFLCLAAVAAATVGSVQAEELLFGDLNYFMKKGQVNVTANAVMGDETARKDQTTETKVDGYFLNTTLALGLADHINAFVGLDYLHNVKTEVGTPHYDTNGLQNPKFGGNVRLLNQDNAGVNFDVGAVVAVKFLDRETGSVSPKKDGDLLSPALSNHAEPRNTLDVNARVGKKWDIANEVYFLGGVTYHQSGKYKDLGANDDVSMESSVDVKAGAFYQYRPVDEFMTTLGVSGTRFGEFDGKAADGTKLTSTSHIDLEFLFQAKYLVNDNLIAKFMMSQDRRSTYEIQAPSSQSVNDKRQSFNYGLGVDFLF